MSENTTIRAGIAAAVTGVTVLASMSSAAGAGQPRSIGNAPTPSIVSLAELFDRHTVVCLRVDVVPVEVVVVEPCYIGSLAGAAAAGGGGAGGTSPSRPTPTPDEPPFPTLL